MSDNYSRPSRVSSAYGGSRRSKGLKIVKKKQKPATVNRSED